MLLKVFKVLVAVKDWREDKAQSSLVPIVTEAAFIWFVPSLITSSLRE